jgi:hypothetical protein
MIAYEVTKVNQKKILPAIPNVAWTGSARGLLKAS